MNNLLKTKKISQKIRLLSVLLILGLLTSCMNSGPNSGNEPLIQVGDRVMTVLEFNEAFEIVRSAYPQNIKDEPDDLRNAQLRLLNQLAIEMIILERAEELELSVSDDEMNKAVNDIKSDYPEDTFEKTLLKTAVSYESWKARLKNRMLMQKVIDHELKDQIVITPEDIADYYERNIKTRAPEAETTASKEEMNEMIIKFLRREKTEQAYQRWINNLKKKYPIDIDSVQWENISGSKYIQDQNLKDLDLTQKPE
ncbi:MAG: SurA N-terminal domain-containing protein [Desulfobacterales bacterium]|nr:SurA N-terminal domain-containing protein [Desulfobacterales bacterium]